MKTRSVGQSCPPLARTSLSRDTDKPLFCRIVGLSESSIDLVRPGGREILPLVVEPGRGFEIFFEPSCTIKVLNVAGNRDPFIRRSLLLEAVFQKDPREELKPGGTLIRVLGSRKISGKICKNVIPRTWKVVGVENNLVSRLY